jgi:hypothetical protein
MGNVGSFSLAPQEGGNDMKLLSYLQNDLGILIVQASYIAVNDLAV